MHLATITRYPLKGFAGELLEKIQLEIDCTLPRDRQYALQYPARISPKPSAWRPKKFFVQSVHTDICAEVKIAWKKDTVSLKCGDASLTINRQLLEDEDLSKWIASLDPRLSGCNIESLDTGFTDESEAYVSLLNRATITSIAAATSTPGHPERYRGNLLIDNLREFNEAEWIGRNLLIGEAQFQVVKPIVRCKATECDWHGSRMTGFLDHLEQTLGLNTCGIFLRVTKGGSIAIADKITLLD